MSKSQSSYVAWVVGGILLFFVLVGASFYLGAKKIKESITTKPALVSGSGDLAILPINGVIMDSADYIEALEDLQESRHIKAILIHIRSPGGAVAPTQEIFHKILKVRETKPVFCSMGEVAASGGYYLSAACEKVYARPGTLTGSIGVIMQLANLEGLYSWAKVKPKTIKAGRFKDMGSPTREMTEAELGLFQNLMDEVHRQFKADIVEHRKMKKDLVEEYGDGRIMTGETAFRLKFVDGLGGELEAIEALTKKAKLSNPEINRLRDPTEKFHGLWGSASTWLNSFSVLGVKPFSKSLLKSGLPYFVAPYIVE